MRIPLIAGNWKMYQTVAETVAYIKELKIQLSGITGVDVVLCPPYTALFAAGEAIKGSSIHLAAQNMHWQEEGAYTGEIAPDMLKEVGCEYVIIGHSERRQYFGETNETVNQKIKAAQKHGLIPIVCVGETLEQRETGITEQIIGEQVKEALVDLTADQVAALVIAYEPIWAIGTGRTASADDAQQVNGFIRKVVEELVGQEAAEAVRIQYGGSVKPDNIKGLMAKPDVDGALVGGASLKPGSFAEIVKASV